MLNALMNRLKESLFGKDAVTLHVTDSPVQEILALAESNRQKMFVSFTQDGQSWSFVGSCIHLDSEHILINIGEAELPGKTADQEAQVHFATHESGTAFYKFTTRIRDIRNKLGKIELLLDLPKELARAQRRGFFRLTPPQQAVRILCPLRGDDVSFLPDNVGKESFLCDSNAATWSLVNISATGMRIAKHLQKKGPRLTFENNDRLICYLELIPPDDGELLRIWQICAVAYASEEEDKLTLGLNSKAWTEPVPDSKKNVWNKLDTIGYIDPLHRWILKHQFKKNMQDLL